MIKKRRFFTLLLLLTLISTTTSQEYQRFTDDSPLHHNQWELLIYRPINKGNMNITRCWLKLTDENDNIIPKTDYSATYFYPDSVVKDPKEGLPYFGSIFHHTGPRKVYNYQRSHYLDGGMIMHLTLKPGKYKISFYTPQDQHFFVKTPQNPEWNSNIYEYDTNNPAKVIFVSPTVNENGFYNGGWLVDYKAPSFFEFTK